MTDASAFIRYKDKVNLNNDNITRFCKKTKRGQNKRVQLKEKIFLLYLLTIKY